MENNLTEEQLNTAKNTLMINNVKKELYKSKNDAIFSHYSSGNLYYNIDVLDGTYQFPISTIEKGKLYSIVKNIDENAKIELGQIETIQLAEDLGTTPYTTSMYGAHLNRWIQRAIEKDEFIKIK